MTVKFVELLRLIEAGETAHCASAGAPAQLKVTLWLKPPTGRMFSENVAAPPGETLAEVDEPACAASTKSSPLPVIVTTWGLPLAPSVRVTAPLLAPAALGRKATLRVQLALTATIEPQLLDWTESPLAMMLAKLRTALPVLLTVTVCGLLAAPTVWAAKVKAAGASKRLVEGKPSPVRITVWVAGVALSVTVSFPVLGPTAMGLKVTEIVHDELGARVEPQLLVSEK